MILSSEDKALYLSRKDEKLPVDGEPTILEGETIDIKTQVPELKTVTEPEKTVDTGNGIYTLKPSVPITTLKDKKLYVDIEKLLEHHTDDEAEKIVSDLTNDDLPDATLQKLIIDGIISDKQPTKETKKIGILDKITNFLYNLIYN